MAGGRPTAIYVLKDDLGNIRYVGKTVNPKERLKSHVKPSIRNDAPCANWCRKMAREGRSISMDIVEWVTGQEWEEKEQEWIAKKRSEGCNLLNVSLGGNDMSHARVRAAARPAYRWIWSFCMNTNRRELWEVVKNAYENAEKDGTSDEVEAMFRDGIIESRPMAKIGYDGQK